MFKKSCLLLIPLFGCLQMLAQNPTVYFSNNQIEISYTKTDCNDAANGIFKQYLLLQVKNLTSEPLKVSFKKELWYNDTCTNCESNSPEHISVIELQPGATETASCENNDKTLKIFTKMLNLNASVLTKFELKKITVNTN